MVEQVTQVVEMVAEKLGVAAEKVYPMLVNQAGVFGATYEVTLWILGISVALLVASIIAIAVGFSRDFDGLGVAGIIGIFIAGIIFIISGIVALCDLSSYLTALHNPEWWAIEYVTKLLT